MDKALMVNVELALHWQSRHARHIDRSFFERINLWRDFFPGDMAARLAQARVGEPVSCAVSADDLAGPHEPGLVRTLRRAQFHPARPGLEALVPVTGRFYPRNFLRDLPDFYPEDRRPFRCLSSGNETLTADFNHPFAGFPATLHAQLLDVLGEKQERGGRCNDLAGGIIDNGPGMQAALANGDTDFFAGEPFVRMDPRPDLQFYREPRLVQHLDRAALADISRIYGEFMQPGMRVLDLMSSWVSHLPGKTAGLEVTGLGLNQEELERNPVLNNRLVHDLNADPRLPFENASFDAAICTVSVEYLIRPIEVIREVARVLRPGAPLVVTFSDRWFPTKVITLWTELHPFERIGLVIDYFRLAGGFTDLASISIRGRPRPADDAHAAQRSHADPVFAVSGVRRDDSTA